MKSRIVTGIPQGSIKRILTLIVVGAGIIGVVFLINIIMRGSGEHERALAEAVITSFKQKDVSATIDASQQSQINSFGLTGSFELQKQNIYAADLKIKLDDQGESSTIPVAAKGSIDKNEIYVKLAKTDSIVDMIGAQTGDMKPMLESIAKKIDGKWLKIQQQESSASDCTSQIFGALGSDTEAQKQVTDSYIANRFVVVKDVKDEDGAKIYTILPDEKALRGFVDSIKQKDFFKKLDSCGAAYDPLGTNTPNPQNPQQPATPQQPEQQPSPIRIKISDKGMVTSISSQQQSQQGVVTAQVKLDYKAGDAIALPHKNIVNYDSISSEVQQVIGAYSQQQQAAQQQQMPMMPQ